MKKILFTALLLILVIAGALVVAHSGNEIEGTWRQIDRGEIDVFNGNISISKVKTQPGSSNPWFMVFADSTKNGLSCAPINQTASLEKGYNYFLCIPVLLNKIDITPDDRIDEIVEASLRQQPLYLKLRVDNNLLNSQLLMAMLPLSKTAGGVIEAPENNYAAFPIYKKNIF